MQRRDDNFSDLDMERLEKDMKKMSSAMSSASNSMALEMLKKFWWTIPLTILMGLSILALVFLLFKAIFM